MPDHDHPECLYLNRGDSNRDESTDSLNSTIGQLLLSYGFSCCQPKLFFPGHSNVVIPPSSSSEPRGVSLQT
jgi:hypothetical protein